MKILDDSLALITPRSLVLFFIIEFEEMFSCDPNSENIFFTLLLIMVASLKL